MGIGSWIMVVIWGRISSFVRRLGPRHRAPADNLVRPWQGQDEGIRRWVPSLRRAIDARGPGDGSAGASEAARDLLGPTLAAELARQGFLDIRSRQIPGLTYRVRVGRRIELLWDSRDMANHVAWPYRGFLCVNPRYPIPAVTFAAQLYLYLRDREEQVLRVANPQPYDDRIAHVI